MRINVTINRMVDKEDSNVKAFASASFDGLFAVHGIRIMEGERGRFVNMPSTSYTDKDGSKKYSDTFHPVTKEARDALNTAVLNAYEMKLQQTQASQIDVVPAHNGQGMGELSDFDDYP